MPFPTTRITAAEGELIVAAHIAHVARCRQIPGRTARPYHPDTRTWHYHASPSVAQAIAEAFAGLPVAWSPEAEAWKQRGERQYSEHGPDDEEMLKPIPLVKTTPWKHQVVGFWWVVNRCWGGLPTHEN